jgi:hypothetical protein
MTLRTLKDRVILLMRPDTSKALVKSAPTPQAAVSIFRGEWASRLPAPLDTIDAGSAALFEDSRIHWALEQLGGVRGKTILDLGPLEGGHPYMFEQAGASEVVGIESNPRAFMKCLITKELLGLRYVSYHCGDFMEYLRQDHRRFDVINASGVLYHQQNPAELLALICRTADAVILWTHYYDETAIRRLPRANIRFPRSSEQEYERFTYRAYRHDAHSENAGLLRRRLLFGGWNGRRSSIACERSACRTSDLSDVSHPNGPEQLLATR